MKLTFTGIPRPVDISGCPELLPLVDAILAGWPHEVRENDNEPIIRLARTADGYGRTSPWLKEVKVYPDPVNAVCDLVLDVINAYLDDNRDLLCLHAAAVSFPQGVVLLLSDYEGGKSTLAVRLMARGHPLYTDDVIPYAPRTRQALALGVMPRLRQPPPTDGDPEFEAFIAARPGPASERFLYVTPKEGETLPFGTGGDIAGIVTLHRKPGVPTTLAPLEKGEALKLAVRRNFVHYNSAFSIRANLRTPVEASPCYTLSYEKAAEAAAALEEVFSGRRKGWL